MEVDVQELFRIIGEQHVTIQQLDQLLHPPLEQQIDEHGVTSLHPLSAEKLAAIQEMSEEAGIKNQIPTA